MTGVMQLDQRQRAATGDQTAAARCRCVAVMVADDGSWPRLMRETQVRRCRSVAELERVVEAGGLAGVVAEPRDPLGGRLDTVLQAVPSAARLKITLLVTAQSSIVADAVGLLAQATNVRLAIRDRVRPDDVIDDALMNRDWASPEADILEAVLARVTPPMRGVVVGAALVGARRNRVAALAHACGTSPRTLERRLACARMPHASHLLAWMLTLHALWQVDVGGWPIKRAAAYCGHNSAAALDNVVRRHTGRSLRALARGGGVHAALAEFADIISEAPRRSAGGAAAPGEFTETLVARRVSV